MSTDGRIKKYIYISAFKNEENPAIYDKDEHSEDHNKWNKISIQQQWIINSKL